MLSTLYKQTQHFVARYLGRLKNLASSIRRSLAHLRVVEIPKCVIKAIVRVNALDFSRDMKLRLT